MGYVSKAEVLRALDDELSSLLPGLASEDAYLLQAYRRAMRQRVELLPEWSGKILAKDVTT